MTNDSRRAEAMRLEEEQYKLKERHIMSGTRAIYLKQKKQKVSASEAVELDHLKKEIPLLRDQLKKIGTELRQLQVPYLVRYSLNYADNTKQEFVEDFYLSTDLEINENFPDYSDKDTVEFMKELMRKLQVRGDEIEIDQIRRNSQ